jgi:hypothetical protein
MSTLPCISVLQPYAWLIVHGIKPVENRTWSTKFRGRILIHAGKRLSKSDHELYRRMWERHLKTPYPAIEEMTGGIIGEAVVTDCVTEHPSEYFFGPFGFVMAQPKAYQKLIPYRGQLSIFGVPSSVLPQEQSHAQ